MSELAGSGLSPVAPVKARHRTPVPHAVRASAAPRVESASPTTSIQKVLVAMATCLLLALLLNARAVVHDTEGMPDGLARTVLLAIGQRALSIAEATHLTWPRDLLDAALGHSAQPAVPPLLATGPLASPSPRAVAAPSTASPTVSAAPSATPRPAPTHAAAQPATARPTAVPPTQPPATPVATWQPPAVLPARRPTAIPVTPTAIPAAPTRPPGVVRPTATPIIHRPAPGHPTTRPASTRPTVPPTTRPTALPTTRPTPKPPPPAPGPPLWQPSVAHPLRLLVTGDSLPGYLGPVLVNEAAAVGPVIGFVDVHDGTGLTRPDFVDWSLLAHGQVVADHPDAVVVWIGGNDFQNMTLPNGAFFTAGTPAWTREYQRRAEICLRIWLQSARRVYWLSMPPARNSAWAHDYAQINVAIQRAAARLPGTEYVDILGPITNHGRYADYVYDGHGQPVLVRESDGVHVNIAGSTLVAHELLRLLEREWRLGQKPAPTPPAQHARPALPLAHHTQPTARVLLTDAPEVGHPEHIFHMGMPRLYCWVRNSTLPPGAAPLRVSWVKDQSGAVIASAVLPRAPGAYSVASNDTVDQTPGTYRCDIFAGGRLAGFARFTVIP